ncbi:GNAT family N-acetyltransferase [Nocardioides litoris]|uniref:GNAT family N-acetyltransferase n=1 Tax=Nocardioides litoris TaxID=1926648 RepID=UPI00112100E7|nr:GNAT family N-acetyltransferase [Nocardioides litoris]
MTALPTRLDLRPMAADDVDELFAIFSQAAMWAYDPPAVHRAREQTADYVRRAAARWDTDGLSYWTARLRATGEVVGSGGAQRHAPGHWNLNYRVAPAHQGRGLAGEVLAAALDAAAAHDADAPCIAFIDLGNPASWRVARRGGLADQGLRRGSVDGVVRHAWADRPLDDATYPPVEGA